MDEFDNTLRPEAAAPAEEPREVVLRYDAPEPEPVVERYVQPEPLPGRARTDAAPPVRQRSRRGLWIFLACVGVLLGVVVFTLVRGMASKADGAYDFYPYERPYPENGARHGAYTSIPRCPNGDDVRLRITEARDGELTIQQVYERVNPCTVTVVVATGGKMGYVGTGVILTEDGYILTNAHLVEDGREACIILDDGTICYDVMLVGYDITNDLAVLKADAEGLSAATFGDSDALTVGDTVYAIGNPMGFELRGTLTDGIVSAINRDVLVDGEMMTLIQTNAALNEGNSGGPLINVYGQVVGINVMKMGAHDFLSVEGLGFAIPVSSTAWMVDDLIAYGELRGEPVLGITVSDGELATGERAVIVYEVEQDSGADAAGIRAGDAIVRADGEATETNNDLLRIRRRFRAGDTLTLEIDRDGERRSVDVTLRKAAE